MVRSEMWANNELAKTAKLNSDSNNSNLGDSRFDLFIKKFKLRKYDTSKDFLQNFLAVLENVSFLIDYSKFMREKIYYNSKFFGLSKTVDLDKTFTKSFDEKFYGYKTCLDLIVISLNNLMKSDLELFKNSGLSSDFVDNFAQMRKQFVVCETLYKNCVYLKLNPNRGNLNSSLNSFNLEYIKFSELFENLVSEYNYMKVVLEKVRDLNNTKPAEEFNVAA